MQPGGLAKRGEPLDQQRAALLQVVVALTEISARRRAVFLSAMMGGCDLARTINFNCDAISAGRLTPSNYGGSKQRSHDATRLMLPREYKRCVKPSYKMRLEILLLELHRMRALLCCPADRAAAPLPPRRSARAPDPVSGRAIRRALRRPRRAGADLRLSARRHRAHLVALAVARPPLFPGDRRNGRRSGALENLPRQKRPDKTGGKLSTASGPPVRPVLRPPPLRAARASPTNDIPRRPKRRQNPE